MSAASSSGVFFVSGINHCELRLGQQLTIDHLRALQQQQLAEQAERARLHQLQQQAQQGLRAAGVAVKADPGIKKEEDGAQQQGQQQLQYAALLALQLQQQQAARAAAAVAAAAQQQQAAAGASGASKRDGPSVGRPRGSGGRGGDGGHGGGRGHHAKHQAKAKAEEEEPATDQWVQCSKCQQWRQVPDEFWPDIANADEDEDWLCKDALWDVEDYEPHTPACC